MITTDGVVLQFAAFLHQCKSMLFCKVNYCQKKYKLNVLNSKERQSEVQTIYNMNKNS